MLQEGGFYCAEDADSLPTFDSTSKKEGAFCVFTKQQLEECLSAKVQGHSDVTWSDVFCFHYDVKEGGNTDPAQVVWA